MKTAIKSVYSIVQICYFGERLQNYNLRGLRAVGYSEIVIGRIIYKDW